MKIFFGISSSLRPEQTYVPLLKQYAAQDRFKVHAVTDDPKEADIILFIDAHVHNDWSLRELRHHPLVRQFPQKTLVYNEKDMPWCVMPGVYVSMPKSAFDPRRQRSWSYLILFNPILAAEENVDREPDLLFSFMGQRSHKIRNQILTLSHPRAFLDDTSHVNFFDFSGRQGLAEKVEAQKRQYTEIVRRSKFVICPRGAGASSIRLFEVLAAGRVPVIVSDEWVAPSGPAWDQCTLQVCEEDIGTIPALLEANEARYRMMACQARCTYQEWFAPEVMFHHLAEKCQEILKSGYVHNHPGVNPLDRQYLRCALRSAKGQVVKRLDRIKSHVLRRGLT